MTTIASMMYVILVVVESIGLLPPSSIFLEPELFRGALSSWGIALQILSIVCIWFIVWYLAAKLSSILRHREMELIEANRRLIEANTERISHMLQTTHELKAPFAAICANIQLLERGSLGAIPEKAVEVLRRMGTRCKGLSQEIKEMLQLANLESTVQDVPQHRELDLMDVIESCLERILPTIELRNIKVEQNLEATKVLAVEDHMIMLFENLLANAVAYSHDGGTVRVECRLLPGEGAVVVIGDEGIGIKEGKLSKIFDAYYRTDKAVQHNQASTGLGLTIVRHVAQVNGVEISVESAVGRGTEFTVRVPHSPSKKK
ncbi:MAG: sensor histidine kinase [Planctomycetota bacterium]